MRNDEKGQSTIEFVLTFTAAVGFIVLFLKMALNYTNGYMVHHATFMASRSYLVGDNQASGDSYQARDANAGNMAKDVFKKYLPTALIPGFNGDVQILNPGDSGKLQIFSGVYTKFTQVFTSGMIGGKTEMDMRSESFLGREPSRKESATQVCDAISQVTGGGCEILNTLEDNGG